VSVFPPGIGFASSDLICFFLVFSPFFSLFVCFSFAFWYSVGAFACYDKAYVVERLPKTRSGKILRRTLRSIVNKEKYEIPATIEDPAVIREIEDAVAAKK